MKCFRACLVLFLVMPLFPPTATPANLTLTNGDTSMSIDTDSSYGIYELASGSVNHLYQHWFWYRVGATGPERAMTSATMTLLSETNTSPSSCTIVLATTNFQAHMSINLEDNPSGPNTVGSSITLMVTNTNSVATLDLHLFAYTDFDLNNTIENAWLRIDGEGAVQAIAGTVSREVLTPAADAYAVDIYPDLVDHLEDAVTTNLNNSTAMGPADNTYAHQWNVLIDPGNTFTVNINMDVTPKTNFAVTACVQTGSVVRLRWESNPMEYYTVKSLTNIMRTNWAVVGALTSMPGDVGSMSVAIATNRAPVYYRVYSATAP